MKIIKISIAFLFMVISVSGCASNSSEKVNPDSFEQYQNKAMVNFGNMCTVVLDENSNVYTFGQDYLGYASSDVSTTPTKIMGDVKQILTVGANAMALKKDGSLWIWGSNELYGQCGVVYDPANPVIVTPIKLLDDVVFMAPQCASSGYSMVGGFAIKSDGTLWGWGKIAGNKNASYEKTTNSFTPFQIDQNVKMVYGSVHEVESFLGVFYYIKDDGSLWACGSNALGMVGKGTTADDFYTPVRILDAVAKVSVGEKHVLALKTDGTVWAWGNNEAGQIGKGSTGDNEWSTPSDAVQLKPVQVFSGATDVDVNENASYVLKEDGSLWGWGSNDRFQLGHSDYEGAATPAYGSILIKYFHPEPILIKEGVSYLKAGSGSVFVMDSTNTLYRWGYSAGFSQVSTPTVYMENVKSVSSSYYSTATIKNDNSIWLDGLNPFYDEEKQYTPTEITTPQQLVLPQ